MIIVNLRGGLGNQMFQYATGKALAHRLGTVLKLDVADLRRNNLRSYSLDVFNLNASFASNEEITKIKYAKETFFKKLVRRLLGHPVPFSEDYYIEPHFHYDPAFEILSDDTYLNGYFQSEKYFSFISDLILQKFCFRSPLERENKSMAEQIYSSTSVSIHIRRGDYVDDHHTNSVHGTCGLNYYQNATKQISGRVDKPTFFCFSDDIEWAKNEFHAQYPIIYVDHNGPDNTFEDMRLMSQCKHNIIANSSFSWWGAWLNSNPDKIVIAPNKWFQKEDYDTRDLIPKGWLRL